jgi:hypothetical protein
MCFVAARTIGRGQTPSEPLKIGEDIFRTSAPCDNQTRIFGAYIDPITFLEPKLTNKCGG